LSGKISSTGQIDVSLFSIKTETVLSFFNNVMKYLRMENGWQVRKIFKGTKWATFFME